MGLDRVPARRFQIVFPQIELRPMDALIFGGQFDSFFANFCSMVRLHLFPQIGQL